jgi:hypothetical protein
MKDVIKYIKDLTWNLFILLCLVGYYTYLFVMAYYPYIVGVVVLYFLYKKRQTVLRAVKYLWTKRVVLKKVLPKSEVEKVQDIIQEIRSKGKLSDKDRTNIDLLKIKLQQLQNV